MKCLYYSFIALSLVMLTGCAQLTYEAADGSRVTYTRFLTGSDSMGMAFPPGEDTTCGNWTRSGEGSAQVGHHDRIGLNEKPPAKSWNHAHPSRGCSMDALRSTGGNGRFYCFAVK